MKTGRTYEGLKSEVYRQATSKRDFIAPSNDLYYHPHGEMQILGKGNFGINEHAHRQIAQKLDIPVKYYMRMLDDDTNILAKNVNHWLQSSTEERLIRTLDGNMRAYLSERYRVLDNLDLIRNVIPMLENNDTHVCSCEVTDTHLYLKATFPEMKYVIPAVDSRHKDHEVEAGFTIRNSEVGASALQLLPSLHNPMCKNISTFGSEFKKFHLGEKLGGQRDGAWEFFQEDTKRASDEAIWLQVRDVMQAAVQGELYDKVVDKVRQARGRRIEGDVGPAVREVTRITTLTEAEAKMMHTHLSEAGDLTQYGFAEATTRTAEDLKDYDRASEVERIGGQIIELPQPQWEKIATAE